MAFSLSGFVLLYTLFILIELYLMARAIRQGPEEPRHPPGRAAAAVLRAA